MGLSPAWMEFLGTLAPDGARIRAHIRSSMLAPTV
jgi:hypothetical protein